MKTIREGLTEPRKPGFTNFPSLRNPAKEVLQQPHGFGEDLTFSTGTSLLLLEGGEHFGHRSRLGALQLLRGLRRSLQRGAPILRGCAAGLPNQIGECQRCVQSTFLCQIRVKLHVALVTNLNLRLATSRVAEYFNFTQRYMCNEFLDASK